MTQKNKSKNLISKYRDIPICLFLIVATFAAYYQVTNHEFVNFDDTIYVTENRHVKAGLTLEGIIWSFKLSDKDNTYWHPLTWLSHLLDCELFGMKSGMHHLGNLILHISSSLLLFFTLKQMTGARWRSFFVAALFALHPLNVESVAWVSERKNVLSTFFWMLTLMSYGYYCRQPGFFRYFLTLIIFQLGLLAKPMLVTLPCVLLLLDYWPLGRIQSGSTKGIRYETGENASFGYVAYPASRLLLEKIPFLLLSSVSIVLSTLSLQNQENLISTEYIPMSLRIANALVSYVNYIVKMIWPKNLAVLYPYPKVMLPAWQVAGSGLLLVCVSVLVIMTLKRAPYLATGWLWYLGTLVPVIGLVQGGLWPAMADRWAYIPLAGIYIIIAWGISDITKRWPHRKMWLPTLAILLLSILILATWRQAGFWKNTITLFEHTLGVTTNHYLPHNNLGNALLRKGRTAEAIEHYREALRLRPNYVEAHNNLGNALAKQGLADEAIKQCREALRLNPNYEKAHNNLGSILAEQGRIDEAVKHYREALRLHPNYVEAYNNLGNALKQKGQTDEAVTHYQEALRINPDNIEAHNILGGVLEKQGQTFEAINHYQEALRLNPDLEETHYNLANVLMKQGRIDGAIDHYLKALSIKPDYVEVHNNLGNVFLKKNRIDDAINHFFKALEIQPDLEETHYNLGRALAMKGRIDEAVAQYKEALRINPGFEKAHNNLAIALQHQGHIVEAAEHYQEALRINPEYFEAHNNLGIIFIYKRDLNKAIFHFQKALEINPDFPYARKNLNMALKAQQKAQ
ncbi:tetratricopeptide repeat protein [Thermodesulfobacteriota bacterium]